jgi:succinyl-CoA synthetase beta subunit
VKVHEYQAKALLREFGVAVPDGGRRRTPAQAREIAQRLGGKVVVKAQIHAGGRGKGGGIKLADDPAGAEAAATQILGMMLKTPQTPPEGIKVRSRCLVEEHPRSIASCTSRSPSTAARSTHVVMASQAGGMDIEEVAPRIAGEDPPRADASRARAVGLPGARLAFGLGLTGDQFKQGVALIKNLFALYLAKDCSLAEINPLVVTKDGACSRSTPSSTSTTTRSSATRTGRPPRHPRGDPLDVEASKYSLNYIKLDGNVGCMVNGAGLAMATMDIVKLAGGEPANFLDVGGGASPEQIENAFRILPPIRA